MTFTVMSWQSFMKIPALESNYAIAQFSPTPGHGITGSIVSQTGGTIDGNTVTYTLPLVELGTTGGPLPLSVSFR